MAQLDFAKLASQGRAFDASRAWSEDELAALINLERNAGEVDDKGVRQGLQRTVAADLVRNGIKTVEDYDHSIEVGFEPKSLESVREEAVAAHQAGVRAQLGLPEEESEEETEEEESTEEESTEDESTEESEDETPEEETEEEESTEEESEEEAKEVSAQKKGKKSGKGKATNK